MSTSTLVVIHRKNSMLGTKNTWFPCYVLSQENVNVFTYSYMYLYSGIKYTFKYKYMYFYVRVYGIFRVASFFKYANRKYAAVVLIKEWSLFMGGMGGRQGSECK